MAKSKTDIVIEHIIAGHRRRGRPEDCPLMDWVKAQAHLERDELLRRMVRLPDWEPRYTCDCIVDCAHLYDRAQCLNDQALYVDALQEAGFAAARGALEELMALHGARLEPEIAQRLVDWIAEHHPNPRGFLAQPKVLERIPARADLAAVNARQPGAPPLKGGRADEIRATRAPRKNSFEVSGPARLGGQ